MTPDSFSSPGRFRLAVHRPRRCRALKMSPTAWRTKDYRCTPRWIPHKDGRRKKRYELNGRPMSSWGGSFAGACWWFTLVSGFVCWRVPLIVLASSGRSWRSNGRDRRAERCGWMLKREQASSSSTARRFTCTSLHPSHHGSRGDQALPEKFLTPDISVSVPDDFMCCNFGTFRNNAEGASSSQT